MPRMPLVIVGAAVLTVVVGVMFTGRVLDPGETGDQGVVPLTAGRGVTVHLSDAPVAMPELHLTAFDGQVISNETLRGKVVLLNFWATWCGPCREEIPMLMTLQARYGDRLAVVGLSIDERPAEEVEVFAKQFDVNYPIAMSNSGLERAFGGITAVPSTFVISPDGRVVQSHLGILDLRSTEHLVRAVAGLPTEARVEVVEDDGPIRSSGAAYVMSVPGVDLDGLSVVERAAALERLNAEHCTCGCGLTVAVCRVSDPTCEVSLPLALQIVEQIRSQGLK